MLYTRCEEGLTGIHTYMYELVVSFLGLTELLKIHVGLWSMAYV